MKAKQMGKRHTSSLLTDHLVFTTKFRGKVLVGEIAKDCDRIIRKICKNIDVEVLQMAVAQDHVHIFVQYPPEISLSKMAEKVKSNSSRELREKHPHLVKWCKTGLWAPGSFHGSVGHGLDVVAQYIAGQQSFRNKEIECDFQPFQMSLRTLDRDKISKCPAGLWMEIKCLADLPGRLPLN